MKNMEYIVSVKSEILGNSQHVMGMKQLRNYNVCAYACALAAQKDGKSHTMGMWTVSPVKIIDSDKKKI